MLPALVTLALTAWPADGELHPPPPRTARPTHKVRLAIDPGHGAPDNHGNTGCFGQHEEDHTLAVAQHLAFVLSALGPFEVLLLRRPGASPRYQDRLAAATAWGAELILSLHSDARGEPLLSPDGGAFVYNPDAPGFSVLWSDRGPPTLVSARARLGRLVGAALRQAGFLAYSGVDYSALYRQDELEPAGWVDARPLATSVYFLRASTVPTVIIETHHALDPAEARRWEALPTVDAFALTLAEAALTFARPPAP